MMKKSREFLMEIEEQFQSETEMMLAMVDIAKHTTRHSTIYGEHNEQILIEFLRKYLPTRFTISQGQLVDPRGAISPQCDIIIHDQSIYPPAMVFANGAKILYVHSVYATIEVKTTLNSKELKKSLENCNRIRELEYNTKKIFLKDPSFKSKEGNELLDALNNQPEVVRDDIRIHKFIFAYKSQMSKDSIIQHLRRFKDSNARKGWLINKIIALKIRERKGDIIGPRITGLNDSQDYSKGENTLLAFYRTIYNSLCVHDKIENGTLDKTKLIIKKYNPWGIFYP